MTSEGNRAACIRAEHLWFTYPGSGRAALHDLTFSIPAGQFVAILGANASGKSTLARLIAGLLTPQEGKLEVLGQDRAIPHSSNALRGRVGIVFQSPDDQMVAPTIEREIAFGLENLGHPPAQIRSRVDNMLKRFKLEPYARRSPHHLSGGEKQRLALASVLVMKPDILILDEVTSLLDPAGRRDIRSLIGELRGQCTMLLITQFPQESLSADRILLLHEGRLVHDAPPDELFSRAESDEIHGVEVPLIYRLLKAAEKADG